MRMYTIATALALTACTAAFGQRAETPALKTGTPPIRSVADAASRIRAAREAARAAAGDGFEPRRAHRARKIA